MFGCFFIGIISTIHQNSLVIINNARYTLNILETFAYCPRSV